MISDYIILRAKKEALKSNLRTHKMSALVLSNKKAYSMLRAYNYNVFNSMINRRSIHAEENLIAKAAKRGIKLRDTRVLIYRYKRSYDGPGTSRPCPRCFELLRKAGVSRIIYFDDIKWTVLSLG